MQKRSGKVRVRAEPGCKKAVPKKKSRCGKVPARANSGCKKLKSHAILSLSLRPTLSDTDAAANLGKKSHKYPNRAAAWPSASRCNSVASMLPLTSAFNLAFARILAQSRRHTSAAATTHAIP
jgi:hypothetical protein